MILPETRAGSTPSFQGSTPDPEGVRRKGYHASMHALGALLETIVDYAGLFPPSKLDMAPTVRNFAQYVGSDDAWMLSRLVVPVARFEEFELIADRHLPRGELPAEPPEGSEPAAELDGGVEPWRISALIGPDLNADIDRIFAFNQAHTASEDVGRVIVDAIELKGPDARTIDEAMRVVPEQLDAYFEIPWDQDPRGPIAALAGTGGRAKIRCGGPVADLFPPSEAVARFITACAAAGVALKFTAGLHHPIRAEHNLTYETDSPRGVMHGFLNVFLAACLLRVRAIAPERVVDLLEETRPEAFHFDESGAGWNDVRLDVDQLAQARDDFAVSFGSCSFEEPVADLRSLGLLAPAS